MLCLIPAFAASSLRSRIVESSELKLRSTYFTTSATSQCIGILRRTVFFPFALASSAYVLMFATRESAIKSTAGWAATICAISLSAQSPFVTIISEHPASSFTILAHASKLLLSFFKSTTNLGYIFLSFLYLPSGLFAFLSLYGQCVLMHAQHSWLQFGLPSTSPHARITCCAGS